MGERPKTPLCVTQLGPNWIDEGTLCRSRSFPPGSIGLGNESSFSVAAGAKAAEEPSFLESLRQQAVIGSILGIRQAIATFTPSGLQAVRKMKALPSYCSFKEVMIVHLNWQQALRSISKYVGSVRRLGLPTLEIGAVMLGHSTGFNQAVETVKGENRSGQQLRGFERFSTGLDGLPGPAL